MEVEDDSATVTPNYQTTRCHMSISQSDKYGNVKLPFFTLKLIQIVKKKLDLLEKALKNLIKIRFMNMH
jgi:hypothetical protein